MMIALHTMLWGTTVIVLVLFIGWQMKRQSLMKRIFAKTSSVWDIRSACVAYANALWLEDKMTTSLHALDSFAKERRESSVRFLAEVFIRKMQGVHDNDTWARWIDPFEKTAVTFSSEDKSLFRECVAKLAPLDLSETEYKHSLKLHALFKVAVSSEPLFHRISSAALVAMGDENPPLPKRSFAEV